MTSALILVATLITSIVSGVLGMAGGIMLMALLVWLLSVPVAMMLHGVTQGVANGSRAWLLRRCIVWHVLPPCLLGATLCTGLLGLLQVIPDQATVLILIGCVPWLVRLLPRSDYFNIMHPPAALACGLLVMAAQLLAGAAGPLLDMFFHHSQLTRQQIVATKACIQTLGHGIRLGYYATALFAFGDGLTLDAAAPPWLFAAVIPAALVGTWAGTRLLAKVNEQQFRSASERVILAMGAACIVLGALALLRG